MDKGAASYEKYRRGDDEGFYEIVREYYDGLTAYISGIVGDFGKAEELADDALLKLAVKRPPFRGGSTFKTWLYSIGRNAALDDMRRKSPPAHLPLEEADGVTDGPEMICEMNERSRQLYKALDSINPDHREVLWLLYFENMSTEDIASVMHKNKNAVSQLIFRAKNSLKETLIREGFEYEIV